MNRFFYLLAKLEVPSTLPQTDANGVKIQTVLQVAFVVAGSIALLVASIGAFKYVISQGDPQAVEKAKNTILYAIIGLVVALSAWTLVTFVLNRLLT